MRTQSAVSWLSLLLALPLLAAQANAAELSTALSLNTRYDYIAADQEEISNRGFFKAQSLIKYGSFGLNIEGFVEQDWASYELQPYGSPDLRKSRETAALQEAYFDFQWNSLFLRAGRQPVRWSQSWSVPSWDVFSGRRWNRLFIDPLSEQLTHPDGILLSYAVSDIEAEIFQVFQTSEHLFPEPLPNIDRKRESQTGLRAKVRFHGLDLQFLARISPDETLVGSSVSYALNCCVLKLEGGQSGDQRGFVVAGFDVFRSILGGDLTFGPQLTWYQDALATDLRVESIAYIPLRYSHGRNTLELQYFFHIEYEEEFIAALVSRDLFSMWKSDFKASAFAQNYVGLPGRLFGIYEAITEGPVLGVRLDITASF